MNKLYIVFLCLTLCFVFGCSKESKRTEKNKKKEKGTIEETIDYATGKTPLYEGQRAKKMLIQTSISEAIKYYEIQEGKKPENLQQLVDAGYLNVKYTKDEWGRDLIVQVQNGKLIVRSIGPDKKPNTADDWTKEF